MCSAQEEERMGGKGWVGWEEGEDAEGGRWAGCVCVGRGGTPPETVRLGESAMFVYPHTLPYNP